MVVGLLAAVSVADGLANVFGIVVAIKLLGIGTSGIGYLNIARGAGGLIGGACVLALLGRRRVSGTLAVGVAALGLPLILLGRCRVWASGCLPGACSASGSCS